MLKNNEGELVEYDKPLEAHETNIPGLVWYDLTVRPDDRGSFVEKWNRERMGAIGLPDFGPVQQNVSLNRYGATRGIHAEPWDKYVSVMTGEVFGAWVDLREGPTFGQVFTMKIDNSKAVFVPRGVGNGFQSLYKEGEAAYSYLVNSHWSQDAKSLYTYLNLADPTAAISWPIPLDQVGEGLISDDDHTHPLLADVTPMKPRKTLITGANGQLGRALRKEFPDAEFVTRDEFDITKPETWGDRNWRQYSTIINTAAYTKVDLAETPEGRIEAWQANAHAVQALAHVAIENRLTLVHISSDYVFDGSQEEHDENEPVSPLSVYGQSKAAGDIAAATVPNHYIIRTSMVVGDGGNFVRAVAKKAELDEPSPGVGDQVGRLTFATDLAKAIRHLLDVRPPAGIYNVTNDGEPVTWAQAAAKIFELTGHSPNLVVPVSTEEYFADKNPVAPRPLQSTLKLDKIKGAGFAPRRWDTALREYIDRRW